MCKIGIYLFIVVAKERPVTKRTQGVKLKPHKKYQSKETFISEFTWQYFYSLTDNEYTFFFQFSQQQQNTKEKSVSGFFIDFFYF